MFMFGCKPPKFDMRDYKLICGASNSFQKEYKLNPPEVKDQKSVNSCVAHATSSILEYFDSLKGDTHTLSTNFIYGIQKKLCGHDGDGMYLNDACSIVKNYGDPIEILCRGNNEIPKAHKIAEAAYEKSGVLENAYCFKIKSYYTCTSTNAIKKSLTKGCPVLASIKWYNSYSVDSDGVIVNSQLGGYTYHAVMVYGWNERGFLCQNSWGVQWGDRGRFTLPYEIEFYEAKALIDDSIDIDETDVKIPERNSFLDVIYKTINFIVNFLRKLILE